MFEQSDRFIGGNHRKRTTRSDAATSVRRSGAASTPKRSDERSFSRMIIEFVVVVLATLLIMGVVRHWVVQRYYIPSGSMENTIMPKDYVLASKLSPSLIEVKRGDIVVFNDSDRWLGDPQESDPASWEKVLVWVGLRADRSHQQLIKRVIGLPGDTVECCSKNGRLLVNGVEIDEPYVAAGQAPSQSIFQVTVPPGRLWVMGDNRGHSADSRSHQARPGDGTVPLSDVLGKAVAIAWPWDRIGTIKDWSYVFRDVPKRNSTP